MERACADSATQVTTAGRFFGCPCKACRADSQKPSTVSKKWNRGSDRGSAQKGPDSRAVGRAIMIKQAQGRGTEQTGYTQVQPCARDGTSCIPLCTSSMLHTPYIELHSTCPTFKALRPISHVPTTETCAAEQERSLCDGELHYTVQCLVPGSACAQRRCTDVCKHMQNKPQNIAAPHPCIPVGCQDLSSQQSPLYHPNRVPSVVLSCIHHR